MKLKKVLKPVIVVLVVVNIVTVFLLASNKINEDKETINYISEEANSLDSSTDGNNRHTSVLDTDSEVDVHIQANTDLGLKTEAAVVAKVGKKVVFTVEGASEGDSLSIRGANNYGTTLKNESYGEFVWTPDRSGIFEVVLKDRAGSERVARRVNVTAKDRDDFFELTPVGYKIDKDNNVTFDTSIFNMPKNGGSGESIPTTQFTIGESGIWSKTIKAFAASKFEKDAAKTSIVEGKDFLLDRGTYTITASLKDLYSLDAEDTKSTTYEKKVKDGHQVIIDNIEMVQKKNAEGINVDHFIVHARCTHEDCDLVYAFFVDDVVGTKGITGTVNGYTESNEITIPSIQWTYTLTVKVKHKKNSDTSDLDSSKLLLPNAYEAVASKTVVKETRTYDLINIKDVRIQSYLLDDYYKAEGNARNVMLPVQVINKEGGKGTVYVGSNNYITVNVGDNEDAEKLNYSAWVLEDGKTVTLEPVYENKEDTIGNTFVYYPRSGGKKSYSKGKSTNTIYVVVTEQDANNDIVRKATKSIEVDIK